MRAAVTSLAIILLSSPFGASRAQDSTDIWTGVFTAAQAERGRLVVQDHCGECHREDLSGGEGPALSGPTFMVKWETHSVERLFHKIRDTMPSPGDTGVSEDEKMDSVAYILQQNGFPAGTTELTVDSRGLASLRIVPKGGPGAPRPGALVRAIGCLREPAASRYVLTEATPPRVTTLGPVPEDERMLAAAAASGTDTFELLSVFPRPAGLVGSTVLVKGLYIKTPTSQRINVMSVELLRSGCP
jgi:hypothetical protein